MGLNYMAKSKVYFIKEITSENLTKLYELVNTNITGKVAIKVHSGEEGNQNYLHPEFFEQIVQKINGTIVECNTAYPGERDTSEKHLKLLENHGWTKLFKVDLMDKEGPDAVLDIPDGEIIKKDYVGKNLLNYDSLVVLSHFKGHPMGGFGGALKQLSIGCASSMGKGYIHNNGGDPYSDMMKADQDNFIRSMADAASAVHKHFNGHTAYINVMKNLSVDCDCCSIAEDPCMEDIGILASLDPIALDQACIDLIYNSKDKGRDHLVERIESRHGLIILESALKHNFGSREYELIEVK